MSFTPPKLTDEFILTSMGLPLDGTYKFKVMNAEEKNSKSGNKMAFVTMIITDTQGNQYTQTDNLVFIDSMYWKIKRFWESAGRPEMNERESYEITDFLGEEGMLKTKIKKDEYGMKSEVRDYISSKEFAMSHQPARNDHVDAMLNDVIPF